MVSSSDGMLWLSIWQSSSSCVRTDHTECSIRGRRIAQDAHGFRIQVMRYAPPTNDHETIILIWNSQVTSITFKIYYNLLSCMHLWSHLPFSRLEVTANVKKHVSVRVAAALWMSMSVSKLDAPKNPSSTNPGKAGNLRNRSPFRF